MPAFTARFNVYKKTSYDGNDAKSIRKYVKKKYSEYLSSYFDSLSDGEIIDLVSSVENRAIEQSVPSTRAFYDLDLFLKDSSTSSVIKGTILFPDKTSVSALSRVIQGNLTYDNNFKSLVSTIESKLSNWSALDSPMEIQFDDETANSKELRDMFIECKEELENGNMEYLEPMGTIIYSMFDLDKEVKDSRQKSLSFIIGDKASTQFCNFYNLVSGTKMVVIEIPDLKDYSLYRDFLSSKLSSVTTPDKQINLIRTIFIEISKEFKDTLSVNHYREFIQVSLDVLPTADSKAMLLKALTSSDEIDILFKKAESNDVNFILDITKQIGLNVAKDRVNSLMKTKAPVKRVTKMPSLI